MLLGTGLLGPGYSGVSTAKLLCMSRTAVRTAVMLYMVSGWVGGWGAVRADAVVLLQVGGCFFSAVVLQGIIIRTTTAVEAIFYPCMRELRRDVLHGTGSLPWLCCTACITAARAATSIALCTAAAAAVVDRSHVQ